MHNLRSKLQRFNKCKYHLYQGLLGEYQFDDFALTVDQVQVDPFAPPSKVTIKIPFQKGKFEQDWIKNTVREKSFCDVFARVFARYARILTKDDKGSGNGGFLGIRYGNQKVIESNAVILKKGILECKVLVGLPGFGRTIAGKEAQEFLLEEIPALVKQLLNPDEKERKYYSDFVQLTERQEWLRAECNKMGLIAFVANGSILARASAVSDKAMSHQKAIAFESPKELETSISLPDGMSLRGMGIPKGVTLIAGGGFHGKSTLLSALSHTIYNHIPEDGRELCVMNQNSVFLQAEDGRSIQGTDISSFIHHLPFNQDSGFFQTENASGSSSQAANLIEALELGAEVFLIDEDRAATNFMVRDFRMRALVPDNKETISPLITHIESMKKQGISFIIVTGALGDFMHVADRVIVADNYSYSDQTQKAQNIMNENPIDKINRKDFSFKNHRIVLENSVDFLGKKGMVVIDGDEKTVKIGRQVIDMSAWNHLFDYSQGQTLAAVLAYAQEKKYFGQKISQTWLDVASDLEELGWDLLSDVGFNYVSVRQEKRKDKQDSYKMQNTRPWRYIVKTRMLDWHAALSRMRNLICTKSSSN